MPQQNSIKEKHLIDHREECPAVSEISSSMFSKKKKKVRFCKGCQQGVMPQSVTCILIEDKSCVLTSDQ